MTTAALGKKYLKELNEIPNINSGGCLYAAYAVWLKLQQEGLLLNDKIVIVMYYDYDYHRDENMKFLENKTKQATSSTHFGLSFNGGKTVYDSRGLIKGYKYCDTMIIDFDKTQSFCESSLKYGDWNPAFKRKSSVAQINKKLGLNLSTYLKE